MDMMNITKEAQEKIDKIKIFEADTISDRDSHFTGYSVRVNNTTDICLAYKKIKQISPDADHIMLAYAVKQHQGYHDNGEHSAGKKLSRILSDRVATNTAIFVTRIYGGRHLGPKRFVHIEKAGRDALNLLQTSVLFHCDFQCLNSKIS